MLPLCKAQAQYEVLVPVSVSDRVKLPGYPNINIGLKYLVGS
jgi:hypothetical protein